MTYNRETEPDRKVVIRDEPHPDDEKVVQLRVVKDPDGVVAIERASGAEVYAGVELRQEDLRAVINALEGYREGSDDG